MEERDREVLRETASEQGYTSIAINKDGKHVGGCFIPWKLTSECNQYENSADNIGRGRFAG